MIFVYVQVLGALQMLCPRDPFRGHTRTVRRRRARFDSQGDSAKLLSQCVGHFQEGLIDRLPGHITYLGPVVMNLCKGVRILYKK